MYLLLCISWFVLQREFVHLVFGQGRRKERKESLHVSHRREVIPFQEKLRYLNFCASREGIRSSGLVLRHTGDQPMDERPLREIDEAIAGGPVRSSCERGTAESSIYRVSGLPSSTNVRSESATPM